MGYSYSLLRFVPDPARGEAVNFGLLVGDEEAQDWEIRLLQNYKRVKAIDDRDLLKLALGFADQLQSHILALENLPDLAAVQPISIELVSQLSSEMRNIVQLTEPAPVVAASAEEALDILAEEMLVDPAALRYRFKKKHQAAAATRRAYRDHHVPPESYEERAPVQSGAYDGTFDFAVFNGRALQLVQCWSFQLPNQADLAEQVKSWAWVVRSIREHGGLLRVPGREVAVPPGYDDLDIAAVSVPPMDDQEDRHAYMEAQAAFNETNVRELSLEQADDLGAAAARLLHVAV